MTDILGQSQILSYIIGLSKEGYVFTLISFEKKNNFKRTGDAIKRICLENSIKWIPLKYTKWPPVLSTIWDVFKLRIRLSRLLRSQQVDLIHCRSYLTSLVALKLKKRKNIPFIFDMRGFYADERVEGDLWDLKNPLYKYVYSFLKKKELDFLNYSDAIVSLTEVGAEIMKTWWDITEIEKKISIIPCAADFEVFDLINIEKKKSSRMRLGIPQDDIVITYLGTMGTWYLFDEIMAFFSWFQTHHENAKFLMISPDSKVDVLKVAQKHSVKEDDIIVKFARREDVSIFLDASDLGVFFIRSTFSKRSSSPTKMGEMLAKGIPLVTNSGVGDVDAIIQKYRFGICLDKLNFSSFEEKSEEIFQLTQIDPHTIRKSAHEFFSLNDAISKYRKIYQDILG
ncbi:MAG: glycosyltransferase [Flavobacteriales bacterium]|nr:glycosyltransferase [Flavobacteriales bacterium]